MRAEAKNPTYKLDRVDVKICAMMVEMNLWTTTAIARVFGISRKAVANNHARYYPR